MKKFAVVSLLALSTLFVVFVAARAAERSRRINLPTGKNLTLPVPGYLGRTNSFPATMALSPDGRYGALLNQGYGTQEAGARQSIAILDLSNNQLRDFPDDRLSDEATTRQSYFIGLAFSSDGKHLYASMGSITDPTGERPTSTGNGIAVYKFSAGQVTPERFIKIAPQPIAAGKELAFGPRKTPAGTAPPFPAGFAVFPNPKGDRLLIANNLSDNVVLLDVASGKILQSFDLSRSRYIPSAYPYTVVANKAGTKAWVSLWNASTVAELNFRTSKVEAWYDVFGRTDPTAPSTHPTAMLLSPAEDELYVALSNTGSDVVAALDLKNGKTGRLYHANVKNAKGHAGSVPQAVTLSPDGKRLFVACAALDAIAVFDLDAAKEWLEAPPLGFIPTEWYPSALAIAGNDLLIATAKGEGSGPNNMQGTLKGERKRKEHPYIPTLIGGSIQRISLADIDKNLAAYTRQVEEDNLFHSDGGKFEFAGGSNPIRHVIYVLKENRTYDQILGDLPAGDGDPSLTMYGADITPNEHKLALQFGVLDNFYDSGKFPATATPGLRPRPPATTTRRRGPSAIAAKSALTTPAAAWPKNFRWSRESPTSTIPAPVSSGTILPAADSAIASTENSLPPCGARAKKRNRRRWGRRKKARRLPRLRPVPWPKSRKAIHYPRMSATRAAGRAHGPGRFRRSSACGPQKPRCAITTIRSFRISIPTIPTSSAPTSSCASSMNS